MSVIDSLITDRTEADAERVEYLKARINAKTATESDLAEWGTDLKGAYNASDLNRVGEACAYLYGELTRFGYSVPGYMALRTDWTVEDMLSVSELGTYLSTVAALKAVLSIARNIPSTMNDTNYEDWNNIERVLVEVDATLTRVGRVFLRAGMSWATAGNAMIYAIN